MRKRLAFLFGLTFLGASLYDADAQIRYRSDGRLTYGNTDPMSFYDWTLEARGIYLKTKTKNFLQIDITPGNPRIAGHGDQVVFYNTQLNRFNSIQVAKVLNYSDARAKSNVQTLSSGLDIISRLRPVSYNFTTGESFRGIAPNRYIGSNAEIGLLAQEVEAILPNIVYTDEEGRKLVDYTALIPVLIDAIKSLQDEVNMLKRQKKQ